ncbi:MAG: hypothetical protein ACYDEQ_13415 [Desulfocucumaceae bacterium]
MKKDKGVEKILMKREDDTRLDIVGYNYNKNSLYLSKTAEDTTIIIYKIVRYKVKDSIIVKGVRYINDSKYNQSENKIYLLGGQLIVVDLSTKKIDTIKSRTISGLDGLVIIDNFVISKGFSCFYKIDLNTKTVVDSLECRGFHANTWYANNE